MNMSSSNLQQVYPEDTNMHETSGDKKGEVAVREAINEVKIASEKMAHAWKNAIDRATAYKDARRETLDPEKVKKAATESKSAWAEVVACSLVCAAACQTAITLTLAAGEAPWVQQVVSLVQKCKAQAENYHVTCLQAEANMATEITTLDVKKALNEAEIASEKIAQAWENAIDQATAYEDARRETLDPEKVKKAAIESKSAWAEVAACCLVCATACQTTIILASAAGEAPWAQQVISLVQKYKAQAEDYYVTCLQEEANMATAVTTLDKE
jgi:hypothetical protein